MTQRQMYMQRVLNPDFSELENWPLLDCPEGLLIPKLDVHVRSDLAPHFDVVNVTWSEFRAMTRNHEIPSTELFTARSGSGLRGPTKEEDELWGLANEPGVRVLLHLASCAKPQNSLVIGSGTGLIPSFLSVLSREGARIDAVDLSYQSSELSSAKITVPRKDLDYIPKDERLTAGYYIRYSRSLGIRTDVQIQEHGVDSAKFFEAKTEGCALDEEDMYDLIFVDGSHTYAQAKLDIMYSWSLLRPGGIMVVDDFDKAHVPGLESVSVALHPVLDSGYVVFFVGKDDREIKTEVAFAVKDPAARRPGFTPAVRSALEKAHLFMNSRFSEC